MLEGGVGGEGDPDSEATSVLVWCAPDVDTRGDGRGIEGWKRRRGFASPQQLDGISNIRSWNARNAGQSDLTEKEGGEDRQVRKDPTKKGEEEEEDMIMSGKAKEKPATLLVIVTVERVTAGGGSDCHTMEQITDSVSV